MDLRHHLRVWMRWKLLLIAGVVLAVVLGVFATFKPDTQNGFKLKWRTEAVYSTKSRLFVTQTGFPWGRVTLPGATATGEPATGSPDSTTTGADKSQDFADPARFSNLAIVYAYLAQSDEVRALIRPIPKPTQIGVVWQATGSGDALPLLELTTTEKTGVGAQQLNLKAIKAMKSYLRTQLDDNEVPNNQRVQIQVLNPPEVGTLESGRSLTLSAVAFILVMVGTLLLVYILENLYPRVSVVRSPLYRDEPLIGPEDQRQDWPPDGHRTGDKPWPVVTAERAETLRPGA